MSFSQPNVIQRVNRMDPGHPALGYLAVPQVPRHRPVLDNANPIARFYSEDSPWSSERMRISTGPFGRVSSSQPNMDYTTYREGPGSEVESLAPKSDSGYQTLPPQSIISHEQDHLDQELCPDATFQFGNMNVSSAVSEPADMFRAASSVTDQASQYSSRSTTRSTGHGKEIKCSECGDISKCKSNHKCVPNSYSQLLDTDNVWIGSICFDTTSLSNAVNQTVAEVVKASRRSMISTGIERVFTVLELMTTPTSVLLRIAATEKRFGRA